MIVVDADGHVSEPDGSLEPYMSPQDRPLAPRRVLDSAGRHRMVVGGRLQPFYPWGTSDEPNPEGGFDPKARLVDMDADGVDVSIIFPSRGLMFGAIAEPDVNAALSRAYNDWAADYCSASPDRLKLVGALPQADIRQMISEARRVVDELGACGLLLRPNRIVERDLDDPAYEPFWDVVEELDVPIALHEGVGADVNYSGRKFDNYMYRHACAHPHEMQFACMMLTCGGVLERHPGVRVLFAESGCGWIAAWLDRLDGHMDEWGSSIAALPLTPTEYFLRQCMITCETKEKAIPAMISLLGDENLAWASDYPHLDADFEQAATAMKGRTDMSGDSIDRILGSNAARFFGVQ